MSLPSFKYHPDPIQTGAVVASDNVCKCCNKQRGYVYKRNPYGRQRDLAESICPWCIHSGLAHEKLGVLFSDDYGLTRTHIDQSIIDEVVCRTPGYETWQGEEWASHCNDACEFLGDASKENLKNILTDGAEFIDGKTLGEGELAELLKYYEPKGSPAFYKFHCLHCGKILYASDCD